MKTKFKLILILVGLTAMLSSCRTSTGASITLLLALWFFLTLLLKRTR